MGEYFRGWRRKSGVALLLIALAFSAAWVRSIRVADSISWGSGVNAWDSIMSAEQNLTWQTDYDIENALPMKWPSWSSSALDFSISDDADAEPVWRWRLFGFESGEFTTDMSGDSSHALFSSIPYWSVVIPLTLLSAYLLLSKSRQKSSAAPQDMHQ